MLFAFPPCLLKHVLCYQNNHRTLAQSFKKKSPRTLSFFFHCCVQVWHQCPRNLFIKSRIGDKFKCFTYSLIHEKEAGERTTASSCCNISVNGTKLEMDKNLGVSFYINKKKIARVGKLLQLGRNTGTLGCVVVGNESTSGWSQLSLLPVWAASPPQC